MIHVATSAEIGRVVRRGLRVPVAFVPDNLLVGPCALDPEVHGQRRCDFWGFQGREGARFRASFRELLGAVASRQRVVAWTSRLSGDVMALWAICAWRLDHRPERPELEVVVLGDAPEAGLGRGSIRVTPADARRGQSDARAPSPTRVREMARCWRKVSGRAPVLSAEGGRAGRAKEELVELGAYQAAFFPRMVGRALALSRFDELLFSCLDKDWMTPVDVFVHRSSAGDELRKEWMTLIGDVFLAMRMRQWAGHRGAEAALESIPYRPDRPMLEVRYRLSKAGDAIRRHGLAEIAQGAPLPVWGVTAYDPAAPWVVVDGPSGQRLERLG
ncbi:hypothetical protein [Sorangium sp. So ce131]|uniref:hypothetical protein n=1 Tax=Sorangium sp. So ce131 TaxID=3133282 RepID=UPI003F63ED59